MSGLIPRGHAERGNWFRQLAHVVHLGRCTRFPFGDCNRHEESEYFTPKDNDIASVVIRWLEFDQDVRCTIRTAAELDALPTLSVILDGDGVVVRRDPWGEFDDAPRWHPLDGLDHSAHDFGLNADEVQLPARLIWNPEWEAK